MSFFGFWLLFQTFSTFTFIIGHHDDVITTNPILQMYTFSEPNCAHMWKSLAINTSLIVFSPPMTVLSIHGKNQPTKRPVPQIDDGDSSLYQWENPGIQHQPVPPSIQGQPARRSVRAKVTLTKLSDFVHGNVPQIDGTIDSFCTLKKF